MYRIFADQCCPIGAFMYYLERFWKIRTQDCIKWSAERGTIICTVLRLKELPKQDEIKCMKATEVAQKALKLVAEITVFVLFVVLCYAMSAAFISIWQF